MPTIFKRIQRQLTNLFLGELAAAITFMIVFMYTLRINLRLILDLVMIYPFSLLIFVLLQGSFYWYYRIRKIKGKIKNRAIFIKTYRRLKLFDLIIIAAYPFIVGYLFVNENVYWLRIENFMGFFVYIFGIVEYVNYFYIRLSYSKVDDIMKVLMLKDFVRSSLNKELSKKACKEIKSFFI